MNSVKHDIALIEASQFLDAVWYLKRYPEVGNLGIGAAEHYVRIGAALLRDPGPSFSTWHYVQSNADAATAGMNPLVHYLVVGRSEGRTLVQAKEPVLAEAASRSIAPIAESDRDLGILRTSLLFDSRFYLETYPDVGERGWDPLWHFVRHGAREGRQPNPWFSTRLYRATYQRAGDETNPLIHYLGHPDNRKTVTSANFDGGFYTSRYNDAAGAKATPLEHYLAEGVLEGRQTTFATPANAPVARLIDCRQVKVTVIVRVRDAVSEALDCIRSVLRHTPLGAANRLLIIDDVRIDPSGREDLQGFADHPGIRVVRNPVSQGYTQTLNNCCELDDGDDIVLLKSTAVVGPHWLRNLKIAAYRTDRTGTVTAVSNNAGAFSVPHPGFNPLPDDWDVDAVARVVADCRFDTPFEVPAGNGFCLYIKRALIDDIGAFDAHNFPDGYGKEGEFCMRALMAGWCHRVDPGTYVGNQHPESLDELDQHLAEAAAQHMQQVCPEYEGAARSIGTSPDFAMARYRIARQLAQRQRGSRAPKPRIMYVISLRSGGTPQTNADLMHAVADTYDCYALSCDRNAIEVLQANGTDYKTLQRYPLSQPIRFATHVSGEYDDIVRSILVSWGIDLLHIRHLAWHSLNLVDVARGLDIPVVHSFHDFYAVCPSVTLVAEDGTYHPTGVTDQVRNPLWRHDPTDTGMTEAWLRHWQARMQHVLAKCDAFVTTCRSARDVLANALPLLAERSSDFHIIPHGRDFARFTQAADLSDVVHDEPLRILLPGNIGLQKGMELVKQLKQLDTAGKLEFHLLGKAGPGLAEHVVNHGPYKRSEFAERVAAIKPHMAVVLSIWPETWCHTLTECWSCGVPVLGIELGAVGERIGEHGGGWLVPPSATPQSVYESLLAIRASNAERCEKIQEARHWQEIHGRENNTRRMAEAYVAVYQRIMHRSHAEPQ